MRIRANGCAELWWIRWQGVGVEVVLSPWEVRSRPRPLGGPILNAQEDDFLKRVIIAPALGTPSTWRINIGDNEDASPSVIPSKRATRPAPPKTPESRRLKSVEQRG